MACCDAFFNPASNSIVPFLFEKRLFDLANSFSSWVISGVSIIAPSLGSVIFGVVGIIPILAIDAMSFAIGGMCTLALKMETQEFKPLGAIRILEDLRDGFSLLRRKELLFPTLGVAASRCLIDPVYSLCIPFLLISYLKAPNVSIGVTQSCSVVGVLLAPILVMHLRKHSSVIGSLRLARGLKVLVFCGFGLFVFAFSRIGTIDGASFLPVFAFSVVCLLGAMVNSAGFAFFNAFLQNSVERSQLGRFAAFRFMLYATVQPLGLAIYGAVLDSRFFLLSSVLCIAGALIETAMLAFIPSEEKIAALR